MSSTHNSAKTVYLISAITLLGAILRFWDLGAQSLWLDEVFTARTAAQSFAGIIRTIAADLDTPPLHPFLAHVFSVLGTSELVLRLPSAIPMVLAIPLTYALARRLLGLRTGILAAAVMAFSPYAVYYAQEARMYGLVVFLTLLTFYCLVRALDSSSTAGGTDSRRWWLGFVLAGVAGLYNHFFGFLVLGLAGFYTILHLVQEWRQGQSRLAARKLALFTLASLAIGLLYLPWLPTLLHFLRENYAAVPYGQGWKAALSGTVIFTMLTHLLAGQGAHPYVQILAWLLFLAGLLFMALRAPRVALFVAGSLVLPFALIMTLNPGHFVSERYFIFMLPLLVLGTADCLHAFTLLASRFAAAALDLTRRYGGRFGHHDAGLYRLAQGAGFAAVLLLVPLLSASGLERQYTQPSKPAWRQVSRYLARTVPADDLVVVATFPHWDKEPLEHYLGRQHRRVVWASEDRDLHRLLADEKAHAWWVVYAGSDRRIGRSMSVAAGPDFTVTPFDYLAVVRRQHGEGDQLEDGLTVLGALAPRIPPAYRSEVMRVMRGLKQPDAGMGQPIPLPLPTTEK